MTAKEYLQQIRKSDIKINQLIKEVGDLRKSIVFISGIDYSRDRVQSSPDSSTGAMKTIERWYDLEHEIERRIDAYVDLKDRIIKQIHGLSKAEYCEILYMRYVQYMKLEEIAVAMNYSYNRIKHLHGTALQIFYNQFLKVDTK